MSGSSVPVLEFTDAGVVLPTESEILSGVLEDMNAAFGGGLSQNLETPQGQMASSEAAIIADKNAEIAYVTNQVDPQYSSGRFQDAIGRIYFLTRKPALPTTVLCTLIGVSGTVVPAGTLAQDTNNYIYASVGAVTIPFSGSVNVEFQNLETGPIPCAAGTLIRVYQAVPGWDAITNAEDGILGNNVESRQDFEFRRKNSVSINANGTPGAIYGAVFNVDNVVDCFVIDNPTGDTVLYGATNYPLLPHSVYVAVVGGTDADVANAIWTKKDLGCDMNGNTEYDVTDTSGYSYPYPTYTMKFERPPELPILFSVDIVDDPNLPNDIEQLVKDAIIARFNGVDGTARERIGSYVLASRYYGAVSATSPTVQVLEILIGTATPDQTRVDVGIDQKPTISANDISVNFV